MTKTSLEENKSDETTLAVTNGRVCTSEWWRFLSFLGVPCRSLALLRPQARACWPATATACAGATVNLAVRSKQAGLTTRVCPRPPLKPPSPPSPHPIPVSSRPTDLPALACAPCVIAPAVSQSPFSLFGPSYCGCPPPLALVPVSELSPSISDPFARARIAAVQSRVAAPVVSGPRALPPTPPSSPFHDGAYWCSKCRRKGFKSVQGLVKHITLQHAGSWMKPLAPCSVDATPVRAQTHIFLVRALQCTVTL